MAESTHVVPVEVPGARYAVAVQPGLLRGVGQHLRCLSRSRKAGLVTDANVGPLYGDAVEASLRSVGFEVVRATVPAGESHKTLAGLGAIYDRMLPAGIERSTPLVSLGGGVICDMTGFAAATLLRGVPFAQVPTTLLSMVDASVGGKTGIDHAVGKNLIGAFHQPIAVFIDPAVLSSLPPRELRSGLAECIKHEIIRDAEGFAALEGNIQRALDLDVKYLTDLVAHNVAIKARVVAADPYEKGERAHLNFGHTFAHGIETVSNYAYSHGEAVALGMVAASRLAAGLGMLDGGAVQRITALIARAGLPTGGLTVDPAAVAAAMVHDKKVQSGRIRFVLPTKIGQVTVRDDVPAEKVREAVESLA